MQARDSLAAAAQTRAQEQEHEQVQAREEGASQHTMDYAVAAAHGTASAVDT